LNIDNSTFAPFRASLVREQTAIRRRHSGKQRIRKGYFDRSEIVLTVAEAFASSVFFSLAAVAVLVSVLAYIVPWSQPHLNITTPQAEL
jgi:hypothetical protein